MEKPKLSPSTIWCATCGGRPISLMQALWHVLRLHHIVRGRGYRP